MNNFLDIDKNIQPTSLAQKCPVCNGFGTLKYGELVCHACKGCGYIIIPIEERQKNYDGR